MKTKILLFSLLFFSFHLKAQELKNLIVTITGSYKSTGAFYVESPNPDKIMVAVKMRSNLTLNGYKVVTDKASADYMITFSYDYIHDSNCPENKTISRLDGQIVDLKNGSQIIGTFSYHQGHWLSRCLSYILDAFSKKLKVT